MKKWSISLVIAAGLLVAAFAVPASAGAAGPYCPGPNPGEQYEPCGTPPRQPPKEVPKTCAAGQIGIYPNCVTPTVEMSSVKVRRTVSTVTLAVNAPGTVKVAGKGVKTKTVTVTPGNVKVKLKLKPKEKQKLQEKGKVKVKVKVTYTPTGGSPVTKTIKVTFKAGKKSHK
jgi:hypothetical protein